MNMDTGNSSPIDSDTFRSIIANSLDGFLLVNLAGTIIETNDSYCRMVGYTRSELLTMHISALDATESPDDVAQRSQQIIESGSLRFETRHLHKNGSVIDIEVSVNHTSLFGGAFISFIRDISEPKRTREIIAARMRLMEYSRDHSINELLRKTLDEAELLSNSQVGFYHFLDADQQTLTLQAWSTKTAEVFCKAEGTGSHYPVSQAGVWVDCVRERRPVIHNDYASLPHRKGMPDGHALVIRELVVPVFRNGAIVAILGVGNKPTDYNQTDVETVTLLADMAWAVAELMLSEQSLRQSEKRYRHIVEHQTGFIDRYEPGGILTYVNAALARFAGVTEEQLVGKSFYPFIHEDDREAVIKRIESISIEHPVVESESRSRLPDGSIRWAHWVHSGIFDEQGALIEYQAVGHDVTERKVAADALQESEERYRQLVDNLQNVVVYQITGDTDGTRRFTYVSRAVERLNETTAEEVLADPGIIYRQILPEYHAPLKTREEEAIKNTTGFKIEVQSRLPSGRIRWFEFTSTPRRRSDGLLVWDAVELDITDRKQVEQALAESEERFRSVMETIPSIAVQGYLLDGTVTFWNHASERLYGYPAEEALGANLLDLIIPPDMKSAVSEAIQQMIETGQPIPAGELSLKCKDGSHVPVFSSHALVTSFGRPPELFCLDVDLTEQKQIEEELVHAKVAAEAANTAKSEFLANMSHEIRTPMNGVIGNAQLLRFTRLTEQQEKFLGYIEADANNLISVINDVLDISKIEAGKIEIEQTAFNLHNCISDLLKPLSPRANAKGLILRAAISKEIPNTLAGDQLLLKQILRNLVGNAIKFTEKGTIQIRIELLERSGEQIRLSFSVADTGIGIKPEALETIFAPFSQADASVTRKFGGTGLGLSICRRLVGMMGGDITVESQAGTGSTFHVSLPFQVSSQITELQEAPQQSNAPPVWEGMPLYILLVDDSQTNQTMVANLLRHFGHQVTCSGNGAHALEQWRASSFDIILMDIQMPVMDGVEATRVIREHEQKNGGHTPIIALTAHALNEQREHLLGAGFDGYVSKPIDLSVLNGEMKQVLKEQRPVQETTTPGPP